MRAYDLVRYRNFRTMTSLEPTQFISLSIDPSGEVVMAGSLEPYEVYVWSLQVSVVAWASCILTCFSVIPAFAAVYFLI